MINGHEPDPATGLYLPAAAKRTAPESESPEPSVPDTIPASWLGRGTEDTAPVDVVDVPGTTEQDPPERTVDVETEPAQTPSPEQNPETATPVQQPEPELTVPDQPTPRTSAITRHAARAFAHLVWLAVAAGLLGQIVGWTAVFGQSIPGYVIACTLGAALEFLMITGSSRGLRGIGDGEGWVWPVLFLSIGTACAAIAVVMIRMHFAGPLPQFGLTEHDATSIGWAAAACAVLGYIAHVLVHLPDELANRKAFEAWKTEAARVQDEIDTRARRRLAIRDEVERRQLHAAANSKPESASNPVDQPVEPAKPANQVKPATSAAKTSKKKSSRRPTKAIAVAFAREHGITTAPELRDEMVKAGWTDSVSPQTWRNWIAAL